MIRRSSVLVVGAGPTGLSLALQAHAHGAQVRVVERRDAVWRPSRALILHARTLEALRPLGVLDALLNKADIDPRVYLHSGPWTVPVRLGELALADTEFAHLSLLRQTDIEVELSRFLAERGVDVERGVTFAGVEPGPPGDVRVALRSRVGVEKARCDYLVGCDGATSGVRAAAGIGWRGGGYPVEIVLADAELESDLEPGAAHVAAARHGLMFAFPLGEQATWRLLATRRATDTTGPAHPSGQPDPPIQAPELQEMLDAAHIGAHVTDVAWSSRVRLDHRLADSYRSGRVFVAGDAGHVHSPAGGQGMNTGIQDAINLGWKLAYAPHSHDRDALLDSYEQERRPVARTVLASTNLAFWVESSLNPIASLIRGVLVPLGAPLLPSVLRWRRLVAEGFRTLSQLRVSYRDSPLSMERGQHRGGPRAGDRLPDAAVTVAGRRMRLHELTARPGVHVLLQRDAQEPGNCRGRSIDVHRVMNWPGSGVLVVRPDGYIGLRSETVDDVVLRGWLNRIGAQPG